MTRIAIIGGGIGGLTVALALRQFGFAPEVFEQAPALLEVGAAIAVWPNAMRLLGQLGVGDEIVQLAGTIEQVHWRDSNGKLLKSTRIPKSDAPAVALHRADLQNALLQALPATSINLGKTAVGFWRKGSEVEVRFADESAVCCDLLIGCDGLHSRVRAQILTDELPVFRGYAVWRGTTAIDSRELSLGSAIEIHGQGKRFGIGPVGRNKIGWWATANQDLNYNDERAPTIDCQQELLSIFAGWWPPIAELIAGSSASAIIKTPALDRPSTRKWGQDSVTLLGDAVHPTTPNLGQGGCMAIEDAVILARCLHKYRAGVEGLRAYEKLRYARTKAVASCSRFYGSIGQWQRPWAMRFRSASLSLVPEAITQPLLRIIFDYDAYRVKI